MLGDIFIPSVGSYVMISLCNAGSSDAGGQGACGGRESSCRYRAAGERPGGAEEERRGDQPAAENWGQHSFLTSKEGKNF